MILGRDPALNEFSLLALDLAQLLHGFRPKLFVDLDDLQLGLGDLAFAPAEIDQLSLGQRARVKVQAGNQRTTPEVTGSVTRLSADVTRDQQTGASFYTIRVAIPPEEVDRLGSFRLVAGMQAEVFVETGERTPLQYLLKPLHDQIEKAFRER